VVTFEARGGERRGGTQNKRPIETQGKKKGRTAEFGGKRMKGIN